MIPEKPIQIPIKFMIGSLVFGVSAMVMTMFLPSATPQGVYVLGIGIYTLVFSSVAFTILTASSYLKELKE